MKLHAKNLKKPNRMRVKRRDMQSTKNTTSYSMHLNAYVTSSLQENIYMYMYMFVVGLKVVLHGFTFLLLYIEPLMMIYESLLSIFSGFNSYFSYFILF